MINLIPPMIKEQIEFAKKNGRVVKKLRLGLVFIASIGALFVGAQIYLSARASQAMSELASRQDEIKRLEPDEVKAKVVNSRLASIKSIQSTQNKFSVMFEDVAKVVPKGVVLKDIILTGDPTKPVRIQFTADSYASGATFRDALALSPRVSGADIERLDGGGPLTGVIVIGFKAGAAKGEPIK